jgi:PKD repeat protein
MKKIYSLLIVLSALVSLQTKAQLACTATFTTQFLNGSTVKFIPSPLTLDSPNVFHFWSFFEIGGGYYNYSYSVSPTNTFPTGVFSVGHRVYRFNPNGSVICTDTTNQTITIAQGACLLSADFYAYSNQPNPLQHYYNNNTTYLSTSDSIRWTFGDGSSSNTFHTFHTYANYGIYNVCLRVIKRNPNGTLSNCISEYCHLDTLAPPPCNLQAYFTNTPDSVTTAPATIQFTNQTVGYTPTDSSTWSFGDGTPNSHLVNPNHVYASPGAYMVCLYVKKNTTLAGTPACRDTVCRMIIIAAPCNIVANFTYYRDSLITIPNSYHFTNTTIPLAATDSIRWTFGDGTSSNQVNPTHAYTTVGTFNVCLRVIKRNPNGVLSNCVSEKCYTIIVTNPTPTCTLQSNFTWYRDSLPTVALNTYHFINLSAPLAANDSIRWTFGDGTTSNQVNPIHVYAQMGSYTVCLRIIKRNPAGTLTNCISEYCYTIIASTPCNLQAYFTSTVDSLQQNIIHFTNQSIGFASSDSITWVFGDGTTSNQINPTHTYTTAGAYTVCLRIKKNNTPAGSAPCVNVYCKVVVITLPCNLVANFTWYRDSLPTVASNTYHFTNTSAPLAATDSIRWTFGDGISSNQLNPVHSYAQAGTYNVCLRVIKRTPNGALTNCVGEKCYTIIVPQLCNIVANYTRQADVSNYKRINFTNTTVAPTGATALWNFGDGTTSTIWSPSRIYATAGSYYVCLRIQYGTCVSYKCDTINIVEPPFVVPCRDLAKFSSDTYGNGLAAFAVFYPQNNVQYTWTFGDGTGAQTGLYASHTYATSGTYNACLTAYKDSNCASTSCKNIYITPFCNNITLAIGDVRDSLIPNRIKFTALSNTATTSQQWTIRKIPTSATSGTITINTNNPTYMFLDSGYYNVCVRATYANGCVKEICKTIHIAQNLPGTNVCTLQAFPNPASTVINTIVTLAQPQIINATIYNTTNAIVAQTQQQGVVGLNTISVNIASLPAGMYTIRVLYGGQVCYAPFIKQ